MKIAGIGLCTNFYGNTTSSASEVKKETNPQIRELSKVTPNFNIKVPQNYKKIRTDKLPNNMTLHTYKTSNGYTVSIVPIEDAPSCISVTFDVGSDNEPKNIKGISHFIEHMLFNGTKGSNGYMKLHPRDFEKKVKKMGGEYNGETSFTYTNYFINIPLFKDKDLEEQIKLLAATIENPEFSDEMLEKEKKVVCSEICMYNDDPNRLALNKHIKTFFNIDLPNDTELVSGSVKNIENLTKKDVLDYYNKQYSPQNAHIVVTGDVNPEEVMQIISKNFTAKNSNINEEKYHETLTPIKTTVRKDLYSNKTKDTTYILGFLGPKNNDIKEYLKLQIAKIYLASSESELAKKMYDLNANCSINDLEISNNKNQHKFLGAAISSNNKNSEEVLNTFINYIKTIKPITKEKLESIIKNIKDDIENSDESSYEINEELKDIRTNEQLDNQLKAIKILSSFTPEEINETIKKYFDFTKCAITVMHPEKKNNISFNGKIRKPINETKLSKSTLKNNINIAFYKTQSKERIIKGDFITEQPYNKNNTINFIMTRIYQMGTKNLSKFEFEKILENLNLGISCNTSLNNLSFALVGSNKNYQEGLKYLEELIYNPAITQENLDTAKKRLKEDLEILKVTPSNLYENEFLPTYNKKFLSVKEILESIDKITLDDVKDFHNYLLTNSKCNISANLPENNSDEVKNNITSTFSNFKDAKGNSFYTELQYYKDIDKPVVLTSPENDTQANIQTAYLFKAEDGIKNSIILSIFTEILNNSSIGLHEILREKEKLCYSAYSYCDIKGDLGQIFLKILTTTDDKENNIHSYENLKRSIEGFKRLIKEIAEGKFTEEDFDNAKLALKADMLSSQKAIIKINNIQRGLCSKHGITFYNQLYDNIDAITKEDIINFAKKLSSIPPVYTITASKETLDANKEYLSSLKK